MAGLDPASPISEKTSRCRGVSRQVGRRVGNPRTVERRRQGRVLFRLRRHSEMPACTGCVHRRHPPARLGHSRRHPTLTIEPSWSVPPVLLHSVPNGHLAAARRLLQRAERAPSPGDLARVRAASRLARASATVRRPRIPCVRESAGLSSERGQIPRRWMVRTGSPQRHAAGPTAQRADYLKGTVTGPGTLENTAMKSRSSGVR
jgi:hypothetical protein